MATSNDDKNKLELVNHRPTIGNDEWNLLNAIAERSLEIAETLLDQLFSATDDLFYELSERASTNNEENLYFEAMRAIRVGKDPITKDFHANLIETFKRIPDMHLNQDSAGQSGEDDLTLVEREDLEIELAQKNMADRTRDSYKRELYDLECRLDHVLVNCRIDQQTNPLDPFHIAKSFISACSSHLNLEIKSRLIFFKLFEKHFLKQLGHLYADANQILIDAGILPKVPKKTVNANETDAETAIHAQEQIVESENFESFSPLPQDVQPFQLESNALASLMASIRAAQKANVPGISALGNYHFYSNNPGVVMPKPELSSFLTDTQRRVDDQLSQEAPKNLVSQIITDILSLKNPEEPQALDQPDEDIINLVALFFDKVLEDENIPLAIQSLICRLQIPVLKIALHDKTFLTNDVHPARLLINTITQAGLSFDDSKPIERDPLFRLITEGIQRINHQFKLDHAVFSEVTDSLKEAMQTELNKSAVVETRTKQTETGKAKLKAAKTFAQNALFDKLRDVSLPEEITEFLTNTWLQTMIITYVRAGKDCSEWVEQEQLISDLIWVSQKYEDEKSQARQQRLIPEVLYRLEQGMEQIIDDESSRRAKTEQIHQVVEHALSPEASKQIYKTLNEEQKNKLGRADPETKTWEEMTALEKQQSRYEELSSQFYLEAKHMAVGTWLEYDDDSKGKTLRCKLSAKIDSETYIFVNRFGFKALTKTRRQFAYDMQFKKAKTLDATPMFERLMDKVVTQIKTISNEM